jgi:hypothetical protein
MVATVTKLENKGRVAIARDQWRAALDAFRKALQTSP